MWERASKRKGHLAPASSTVKRAARTCAWVLVLWMFVQGMFGGCTAVIHPPEEPGERTDVYLVDYGMHAGLVLPAGAAGKWIEYQYGDWNYFALANDSWYNAFPALLWPTQGALGRRTVSPPDFAPSIEAHLSGEMVLTIPVSGTRVRRLRRRLNRLYQQSATSEISNERYDLTFVRIDDPYSACNHCNDVMVEWLTELNCTVHGSATTSSWMLSEPPDADAGE